MMKTEELLEVMQTLSLAPAGAGAYGIVEGWPVIVTKECKLYITIEKLNRDEFKDLKESLKPYAGVNYAAANVLRVSLKPQKYNGSISQLIVQAVKIVKQSGIILRDSCKYCKQGACDRAVMISYGNYSSMERFHKRCLDSQVNKLVAQDEENSHSGSYLLGTIGAVIGMLIGCVPNYLGIRYAERIFSLGFALIPICAYFGYKLFKGKMNSYAVVVSVFMAVFGVYAMDFAVLVAEVAARYRMPFSEALSFLPRLVAEPEIWTTLTKESVDMFLFSAIGVFISWRIISGTGASGIKRVHDIEKNAIEYPEQIWYQY